MDKKVNEFPIGRSGKIMLHLFLVNILLGQYNLQLVVIRHLRVTNGWYCFAKLGSHSSKPTKIPSCLFPIGLFVPKPVFMCGWQHIWISLKNLALSCFRIRLNKRSFLEAEFVDATKFAVFTFLGSLHILRLTAPPSHYCMLLMMSLMVINHPCL